MLHRVYQFANTALSVWPQNVTGLECGYKTTHWERKSIYSTTELISTPVEFRCRILEFGCRILKFGCRILEFGCRILLVEYIDLRSQFIMGLGRRNSQFLDKEG